MYIDECMFMFLIIDLPSASWMNCIWNGIIGIGIVWYTYSYIANDLVKINIRNMVQNFISYGETIGEKILWLI